jgi:hypothetical protein
MKPEWTGSQEGNTAMLIAILASAAATMTAQPFPAASTWGATMNQQMLHTALRAPERPVTKGTTYCFLDDVTARGSVRKVCRSRQAWNRLGLDPAI